MPILGLVSTESLATQRFTNIRRKVFYQYPAGAAPLLGILSLMDGEETDDPEYSWYEQRMVEQKTTTASQGSSKGPIKSDADGDPGDPVSIAADTEYIIVVASTDLLRVGHVLKIEFAASSGTVTMDCRFVVTAITSSTKVKVRALGSWAGVDNGTTNENVGKEVLVVGSSFAQGIADISKGIYTTPANIGNYCQIFRTPFSMTGTAVATSLKYDDSGVYKSKAKENSMNHMIELEKAFIFGQKAKTTANEATGLPQYLTGGILHFLAQWELTSNNPYGGSGASADTDDNKRIITNANGWVNHKLYSTWLERAFRVTNNRASEKLVLCGNTFLSCINQMYESRACLDAGLPMTETFGMDVVAHTTPFGKVYYKTHPLFNQNSTLRGCALFLDVNNLKYRYVIGRDTKLYKNRQPNNADYRTDEWITEAGLELYYPESHMFVKNVLDFRP